MDCPPHALGRFARVFLTALVLAAVVALTAPADDSPQKPPPLTAAQQEQLKERDQLQAEVERLCKEGKLAEAVAALEKKLAIERTIFGEAHHAVVTSLGQLAQLDEARADWAAAQKRREEALRIQTKRYGADHWRAGDARRAAADGERRARMSAEERSALAGALRLHGQVLQLYNQGKYRAAADLCRQALAIHQKVWGPGHPDTATSLNTLGLLLEAQGDYAGARPYLEQALATRKKALGPKHPETATSLGNLGTLFYSLGDYARARPCHEEALAICQEAVGREHRHTAISLNNLGMLLTAQGDYAGARPHLEQALDICRKEFGPDHPDTIATLNNLGFLLWKQRDYAGARRYFEQALTIAKKAPDPDHPRTAHLLHNLGALHKAQGDYAGARRHHEQALAICEKVLGPEHPDTAKGLHNLGYLLREQGDYGSARLYHEQALAIYQKVLGPEHPDTATSLQNVGLLLHAQGDSTGARRYYEQALVIVGRHLDLAAAGLAERQQHALVRHLRVYLDAYLSLGPRAGLGPSEAYQPVLRWKGTTLARRVRLASADSQVRQGLGAYQSVCRRLASLSRATPEPKQREAWRTSLERLTREKEALEAELAAKSEAFRHQQALRRLTPQQLQQALPVDTALVDLFEYTRYMPPIDGKGPVKRDRHLVAFVVRPDRPIVRLDLGPLAPVASAIEEWRKSYGRDGRPGATLRRLVWEPIEAHITGAKVVLISPDGVLTRLPFGALPGKEPNTYLIEERTVAVVPVPQLLPELLRPEGKAKPDPSLLIVGDVQFDAGPGQSLAAAETRGAPRGGAMDALLKGMGPLPGTQAEAAAVKDLFQRRFPKGTATDLRETDATESAVRTQAPKHRYLHFATHGFFAPQEVKSALAPARADAPLGSLFRDEDVTGFHPGLLSGLVLAGAKQPLDPERDDGILTALEVAGLDLGGVELAVLSACETGLGEVAGGEGVLGLQRAFQAAGARATVTGLWKVPDRATQLLMTRFYDNLWGKNLSRLEALREAQLWMLGEVPKQPDLLRGIERLDANVPDHKPNRLPPFYWAGFVLSGDWR